jgi:hypothetical protein
MCACGNPRYWYSILQTQARTFPSTLLDFQNFIRPFSRARKTIEAIIPSEKSPVPLFRDWYSGQYGFKAKTNIGRPSLLASSKDFSLTPCQYSSLSGMEDGTRFRGDRPLGGRGCYLVERNMQPATLRATWLKYSPIGHLSRREILSWDFRVSG